MNKKILIGGILVAFMLVTTSFVSAVSMSGEELDGETVGVEEVYSNSVEEPLFIGGEATIDVFVLGYDVAPHGDEWPLSGAEVSMRSILTFPFIICLFFGFGFRSGTTDEDGHCIFKVTAPVFFDIGCTARASKSGSGSGYLGRRAWFRAGDEVSIKLAIYQGD